MFAINTFILTYMNVQRIMDGMCMGLASLYWTVSKMSDTCLSVGVTFSHEGQLLIISRLKGEDIT
jgi:hypothetical protein